MPRGEYRHGKAANHDELEERQALKMRELLGIPCRLRDTKLIRATRQVLRQIKERFPKDFQRIRRVVREISPLLREDGDDGTLGEWKAFQAVAEDPSTWGYDNDETPGVLTLLEGAEDDLVGLVAHELGHACTTEQDRRRRGDCPFDEWTSELTADWYAYKWGFGRNVARRRHLRDWGHHGEAPGKNFSVERDGFRFYYHISRRFRVRLLQRRKTKTAASRASTIASSGRRES
jgi:hypothetical protein